jgi:hypothetical protein
MRGYSTPRPRGLRSWIVISVFVILVGALLIPTNSTRSLLDRATKMSTPDILRIRNNYYAWISNSELIAVESTVTGLHAEVIDLKRGSSRPLPFVDRLFNTVPSPTFWSFSYSDGLLLLYLRRDPTSISYLTTLDGSFVKTNLFDRYVFEHFRMPGNATWLEIVKGRGIMRSATSESRDLDESFSVSYPIGFVGPGIFLSATNGYIPTPGPISLQYWNLTNTPHLQESKSFRIGRTTFVAASVSPTGTSILWECAQRTFLPHFTFVRQFPFVRIDSRYLTKIYLSDNAAANFLLLGSLPDDCHVTAARWKPDGSAVSIIHQGSLYTFTLN